MSMGPLNRRDLLRLLLLAPCLSPTGCRGGDRFAAESVCVHVYRPRQNLPAPLLEPTAGPPPKRGTGLFSVGLPELVVLSMTQSLVELFPYFWPLTRDEFRAFEPAARKGWAIDVLERASDVQRLRDHLKTRAGSSSTAARNTVVALTMNAATLHWAPAVAAACRDGGVGELVVFKDPTVPPYFCEHPALQKGFRRPPP